MIDLYTWNTSNGKKPQILLEELGVPYNTHPIDIGKDEQFTPAYVKINPNSKIPAIVDSEGPDGKPLTLFESGAILMYLGEKFGRLFPQAPRQKWETIQWLMFQMGGIGPMFGQAHHFRRQAKEQIPYAIERYTKETRRLWGVLDARLKDNRVAGGGRVHHRRHRLLPVVPAPRMAGGEPRRVPQRQALVPDARGAPGGEPRRQPALRPGGVGGPGQAGTAGAGASTGARRGRPRAAAIASCSARSSARAVSRVLRSRASSRSVTSIWASLISTRSSRVLDGAPGKFHGPSEARIRQGDG